MPGSPKQSGRPQVWTSVRLAASVCQSGSLAVVARGIDGIERSSVPVVVSGVDGIERTSVPEEALTRRRARGSADYYYNNYYYYYCYYYYYDYFCL